MCPKQNLFRDINLDYMPTDMNMSSKLTDTTSLGRRRYENVM